MGLQLLPSPTTNEPHSSGICPSSFLYMSRLPSPSNVPAPRISCPDSPHFVEFLLGSGAQGAPVPPFLSSCKRLEPTMRSNPTACSIPVLLLCTVGQTQGEPLVELVNRPYRGPEKKTSRGRRLPKQFLKLTPTFPCQGAAPVYKSNTLLKAVGSRAPLQQWFSIFPVPRHFNTPTRVVSLLLHNCNLASYKS